MAAESRCDMLYGICCHHHLLNVQGYRVHISDDNEYITLPYVVHDMRLQCDIVNNTSTQELPLLS